MSADGRLRGLISRVRNLEDERADLNKDIADVFNEAKALRYDTRIMRQLLKRMRMRPDDRSEADAMLERYESAIGMEGPETPHVDMAPRKRDTYIAPPDASTEQQLRAIIAKVLDLRTERTETGKTITLELRKARSLGFSPIKITEACRWIEKCDQHGRERMMDAEELYRIYREIGEGPQPELQIEGDSKLVEMFASGPSEGPKKATTIKQRQVGDAIAFAQISRMNRGIR